MTHRFNRRLLLPFAVAAIGVLAHHNSFYGVLVFDDHRAITHVRSTDGILWGNRPLLRVSWRPVVDATFLLNQVIGGRVADYHAINLFFHIASALVLYGLVRRSLRLAEFPQHHAYGQTEMAFACAALWVCHPLTTSAVTYVVQRYEVMMTFFYLCTLYCVARATEHPGAAGGWWNVGAIFACWLGMGSKEVMITAPLAVALYQLAFSSGCCRRRFVENWWVYVGLVAGWGILAVMVKIKMQHDLSRYYVWPGFSPLSYVMAAPQVLWRYLRLVFFPKGLCFDYAWTVPDRMGPWELAGCLLLAMLAVILTRAILGHKPWAFPPALALLVLAPTTLIPRPDPVVEYRMYLPLACVLVTAVTLLYNLFDAAVASRGNQRVVPWVVRLGWLVFAGVVLWYTSLTLARNCDYHSAERLWGEVIRLRPENLRARVALGAVLLQNGRESEAEEQFRDVIRLSEARTGGGPGIAMTARALAMKELAMILHRRGQSREAADLLREALRIAPDFVEARRCLALVTGENPDGPLEK